MVMWASKWFWGWKEKQTRLWSPSRQIVLLWVLLFKLACQVKSSEKSTLIIQTCWTLERWAVSYCTNAHKNTHLCTNIETFFVCVRYTQVEISENHISNFLLTNLARFSLDVSLDVTGPCELLQYLEATPKKATTDIGKQLQLSLSFCPRNVCNLQNVILSIKVRYLLLYI